jgi:hypothetical protein
MWQIIEMGIVLKAFTSFSLLEKVRLFSGRE